MKVRLARTAGFCMGVRRAMFLALSQARDATGPIYTYGPLIHNPQVLELLESKGVGVLEEIPPAGSQEGGTVIIRAHGVPPAEKRRLKQAGFSRVVEGACPRVVKVQAIIRRATRSGGWAVIVGDADHPEVVGLLGHAGDKGVVVSSPEEVEGLPDIGRAVVVAQTTQSEAVFDRVVAALSRRFKDLEVHNTICAATHRRQEEVRRLSRDVDCMVVVGGRQSGNTKRLAEIAGQEGKDVFLVETEAELDRDLLATYGSCGLTAGASTPNWMIKRVMRELFSIRSHGELGFVYWARRALRFLVLSQILAALGAAGMATASSLLQGLPVSLTLLGAVSFYIYAMHMLNQFLDKEAGMFNDPDRGLFLSKNRKLLIATGIATALVSMYLCYRLGWLPLILISVMSATGLLYSVPVVPRALERRIGIQRLKDIPGSKSVSASLAWAFIVAIFPAASFGLNDPLVLSLMLAYTLLLVLARCAILDALDVQGDLIVGKETIPIALGEAKTRRLLWWTIGFLAFLVLGAPFTGMVTHAFWGLLIPVGGVAVMHAVLGRSWTLPGSLGEGLVDLNFIIAGLVAAFWFGL